MTSAPILESEPVKPRTDDDFQVAEKSRSHGCVLLDRSCQSLTTFIDRLQVIEDERNASHRNLLGKGYSNNVQC